MSTLDPRSKSQIYLPGTNDRVSQLLWISVADGGSNSTMGYNAGTRMLGGVDNVFVGANVAQQARSMSRTILIGSRAAAEAADRFRDTVGLGTSVLNKATDVTTSVIIGGKAGERLRRTEQCVAIGYKAMAGLRDGSLDVAIGALAASEAANIANVVFVGTRSGQSANMVESTTAVGFRAGDALYQVSNAVVVGHRAAANMFMSDSTVAVGASAARSFTGSFNTIVGAQCAINAISEFSTVVGSRSMNRRQGELVSLKNCVVVGENIQFDNPLTTVQLQIGDAVFERSSARFTDASRPFDPYVAFGPVDGRLVYSVEETRSAGVLDSTERSLEMFASLRLPPALPTDPAVYTLSWYATADANFALTGVPAYRLAVRVSSTSSAHIAAAVEFFVDGAVLYEMVFQVDALPVPIIAVDPATFPYLDLTVLQAHGSVTLRGVVVQQSAQLPGAANTFTVAPNFAGAAVEIQAPTPATPGEVVAQVVAAVHPSISFVEIYGSNGANGGGGTIAAYTILRHAQRVDSTLAFNTTHLQDAFTSLGGAVVEPFPATGLDQVVLVDETATPPRTGFVDAVYDVGAYNVSLSASAKFMVPPSQEGQVGLRVLGYYTVTARVEPDMSLSLAVRAGDVVLLELQQTSVVVAVTADASIASIASGLPADLPIDLPAFRALDPAADVWLELFADVALQSPVTAVTTVTDITDITDITEQLQVRVRLLSYAPGVYESRGAPDFEETYIFTVRESVPPTALALQTESGVAVFANAGAGRWVAREFLVENSQFRPVPEFTDCVFVGSNFTVENLTDRSNIFLLSLGPSKTLLRGTPDVLEVNAPTTSIKGALLLGDSDTMNYLAFRGTKDDGFIERVPRTYIGERIYDPGSQRSELLLFKGDDPPGLYGPDRVRILSGQFRVEVPDSAAVSYVYPGGTLSFGTAGNTVTRPLLTADRVNGTEVWMAPNATPTSVNAMVFEMTSDTQVTVRVRGSDGVVRSAVLPLS